MVYLKRIYHNPPRCAIINEKQRFPPEGRAKRKERAKGESHGRHLYLVPTPIGNLGDISRRMAQTLAEADFIAAEDTRVTLKLLNHLGLKKPMLSYHRHNTEHGGQAVLDRLLAGESCALVTDAGMPAISDPGEELVALCAAAGRAGVVAIPGPCALVTALAVSGLPTGRFTFEGFLAMNKKNRRAHLEALREEERTMIFYEAPHKLAGHPGGPVPRPLGRTGPSSLCRELTKLHEEIRRTTLGEAADYYRENPPKGEFVLVVRGAPPKREDGEATLEDGLALVGAPAGRGTLPPGRGPPGGQELGCPATSSMTGPWTDEKQTGSHPFG